MNYLVPAQLGAQLASLFIFGTMANWYVAPSLAARTRAEALVPLLWVHTFRFVALQAFRAQRDGFPISNAHLIRVVVGDLAGAALALAALYALRRGSKFGIWLCWLLVAEFVYDTVSNLRSGMEEHLFGQSAGVSWLVVGVYVPLLIVTTILLAWQLLSRRGEPLSSAGKNSTDERRTFGLAVSEK